MRKGPLWLLVASLFLFLFIDSYVVQWIGVLGVSVVGLSYAYAKVLENNLQIERLELRLRAYKHQKVTVRLRIANRSSLPMPYLLVTDNPGSLYTGHGNHRLLQLHAREEARLVYTIKAMNRGFYRIGPVNVRFADPLGLFPVSKTIFLEARLVVYPRVYPVELTVRHGVPAGSITAASRVYEDPTRYRSVREYVPGDEIRRVNWKATARLGSLYSTEWLPTLNVPVLILLNLTASDFAQRNRFHHVERTIDAAASLTHYLAERGQEIGLVSTGEIKGMTQQIMPSVKVGAGVAHAVGILETLAQLQSNPEQVDPVKLLLERGSLSPGTRLFYLGPALDEDKLASLLAAVKTRSNIRLYYTEEGVARREVARPETVKLFTITEYGDELFTLQA